MLLYRYDLTSWLGVKLQMQLADEAGMSQSMFDFEFKVSSPPGNFPCRFNLNLLHPAASSCPCFRRTAAIYRRARTGTGRPSGATTSSTVSLRGHCHARHRLRKLMYFPLLWLCSDDIPIPQMPPVCTLIPDIHMSAPNSGIELLRRSQEQAELGWVVPCRSQLLPERDPKTVAGRRSLLPGHPAQVGHRPGSAIPDRQQHLHLPAGLHQPPVPQLRPQSQRKGAGSPALARSWESGYPSVWRKKGRGSAISFHCLE